LSLRRQPFELVGSSIVPLPMPGPGETRTVEGMLIAA
jgi:hypothetical protein